MRILWASNAPWCGTGYGTQTFQAITRLRGAGHEVAVASNHGLQAATIDWHGITVFPSGADAFSNDVLVSQYLDWMRGEPGWLLTLYDVWPFKAEYFDKAHVPIVSWTPIDHHPVPPGVAAWAQTHRTLAMSRFGQEELRKIGVEAAYVPHAIEPVFHPTDRAEARKTLGIPDEHFLVMVNAANKGRFPPRKAWSENLGALAIFLRSHPDAHAYLHTSIYGVDGVDLQVLASAWQLPPDRVHFADQYRYISNRIPQDELALRYAAADVLLATSMGEGFGLPTIEAQACGTPVIVSNFAASPELVGGGWTVDVQPEWDPLQGAFFCKPLIGSIIESLERSYEARNDPDIRAKAIAKAAEYDADRVFEENWKPVLATLEKALRPAMMKPNRAQRRKKRAA